MASVFDELRFTTGNNTWNEILHRYSTPDQISDQIRDHTIDSFDGDISEVWRHVAAEVVLLLPRGLRLLRPGQVAAQEGRN